MVVQEEWLDEGEVELEEDDEDDEQHADIEDIADDAPQPRK